MKTFTVCVPPPLRYPKGSNNKRSEIKITVASFGHLTISAVNKNLGGFFWSVDDICSISPKRCRRQRTTCDCDRTVVDEDRYDIP